MSLIVSAVTWVKRAQLAAFPRQAEDEEEEYNKDLLAAEKKAAKIAKRKEESAQKIAQSDTQMEDADIIREFNLDNYDDGLFFPPKEKRENLITLCFVLFYRERRKNDG